MTVTGMGFAILAVLALIVGLGTLIGLSTWSRNRRLEREAFYRAETLRRIAEQPGPTADRLLDVLHGEERAQAIRRREGVKLGGLITLAIGVGMMALLRAAEPTEPHYLVALIPLLVGAVLLAYAFLLAPKIG